MQFDCNDEERVALLITVPVESSGTRKLSTASVEVPIAFLCSLVNVWFKIPKVTALKLWLSLNNGKLSHYFEIRKVQSYHSLLCKAQIELIAGDLAP